MHVISVYIYIVLTIYILTIYIHENLHIPIEYCVFHLPRKLKTQFHVTKLFIFTYQCNFYSCISKRNLKILKYFNILIHKNYGIRLHQRPLTFSMARR